MARKSNLEKARDIAERISRTDEDREFDYEKNEAQKLLSKIYDIAEQIDKFEEDVHRAIDKGDIDKEDALKLVKYIEGEIRYEARNAKVAIKNVQYTLKKEGPLKAKVEGGPRPTPKGEIAR